MFDVLTRVTSFRPAALSPVGTIFSVSGNLRQARTLGVLPAVTARPNEPGAIRNRWRCYRR
mgnify:FL=1